MVLRYKEENSPRAVYSILRNDFSVSASLLRRLKHSGGLTVDGRPVYSTYMVLPGETLSADLLTAEPPCDTLVQHNPIEILYEDEGLLAVNKPCGTLVHPSHAKNEDTLLNYVCGYLEDTTGLPHAHAANRLDRDTSGVVLYAKCSYMKERAIDALSAETAEKTYIALVEGEMPAPNGSIHAPIRRYAPHDMLRVVAEDGQDAVTHYETLCVLPEGASVLKLRLETGRTHQIRVHLHYKGHPVLGDWLYRTESSQKLSEAMNIPTQALHAWQLSVQHPITKKPLCITAPVRRKEFAKYLGFLQNTP